jgi:hypothetical protein
MAGCLPIKSSGASRPAPPTAPPAPPLPPAPGRPPAAAAAPPGLQPRPRPAGDAAPAAPRAPVVGPGKRSAPLQHHEMQQAGYQLAAKLNGTPITSPAERRRLADANQTMHDTRLALKHGRGNVADDYLPSGKHSVVATAVSERLSGPNDNMLAGTALALGAGKCDAHAEINSRVQSQKLGRGETVHGVVNSELGLGTPHTWSEVRTKPAPGEKHKPSPIVLDSWSTGPAARLEDTVWGSHASKTQVASSFSKFSGKSDFDKMQQIKARHEPGGERHDAAMQAVDERRQLPTGGQLLGDVQLIDPEFAAEARNKLGAMSALSQEVMAVGAAREAYDLNVAAAAKLSNTAPIIDEAGRLDRQDRPPVVKP